MTGGTEVTETVKFAEAMEKFFDRLHVTNSLVGKQNRKSFQDPYLSSSDFRLKVSRIVVFYIEILL